MKKITLSLLLVAIVSMGAFAQKKTKKNYAKDKRSAKNKAEDVRIFGEDDEDFKTLKSPEKWKDESAVVLCQKFDYSYLRQGSNNIVFKETIRKRVKINDDKAIKELSIFYYMDAVISKDFIGVMVVKPDGTENKVDLSDAVEVSANEVPTVYQSNYYYSKSYKKIAIPNLEVGDIIDFYYTTESKYEVNGIHSYSPFIFTLAKTYPIAKQKFFFNVDVGFKVSYRTFNGSPELVQGEAGVNRYGKKKDHIRTYLLEDNDREKIKPEYWKYSFLQEPSVKFQVNYVPRALVARTYKLVSDKDLINEPFDLKEIQKRIPRQEGRIMGYDETIAYIKRYHKTEKDPEKLAALAYYYLRYKFYNSLYFGLYSSYAQYYKTGQELPVKDYVFTNSMIEILKRLKVPCEYVVAVNRKYGKLEDVLLAQELISGIKVGERYFFYFTNYSSAEFIPSSLLGSEAITFKPALKYDNIPFKKVSITKSDYTKNFILNEMTVNLNDEMTVANIKSSKTYKGALKSYFTKMALSYEDYFDNDKRRFDPKYEENNPVEKKPKTKLSKNTKFRLAEEKRKKAALEKENLEKKFENLIEYHADDFEITEYNNFELITDGRFDDKPNLEVTEDYDVEEFINKAGRNYIFNAGALIGTQLKLDKEDMERNADINHSYPKSYEYKIEVIIPAGYTVSGVDQLNYNVDNEIGTFISEAKVEAGKVIINTKKNYKALRAPKEQWKNYIAFLEAAYEFSQKKVIFKK